MHFWEKVRRDLESWEPENFKNTQTFFYWPRNNQVLPRSELQTPGWPVWPASRAELKCQTNNFFAKQLICSQRILSTRQYNKRSQHMPAFFGDSRLRVFHRLLVVSALHWHAVAVRMTAPEVLTSIAAVLPSYVVGVRLGKPSVK